MQVKRIWQTLVILSVFALLATARAGDWTKTFSLDETDAKPDFAVATVIDADDYTYVLATCTNEDDVKNIGSSRFCVGDLGSFA